MMLLRPQRASEHCVAVRTSVSDADVGRVVKAFCDHAVVANWLRAWVWYLVHFWRYA